MGHVLSTWQGVETIIFEIYSAFFAKNHKDVAAITFFAVRTFEARLQLVNALIEHYYQKNQKDEWGGLKTKIRKKSKVRNWIAHGMLGLYGTHPKREWVIGRGIYDITNFPKTFPKKNDFITGKEMIEACNVLTIIIKELHSFQKQLATDQGLILKTRSTNQQAEQNSNRFPMTFHIPDGTPRP